HVLEYESGPLRKQEQFAGRLSTIQIAMSLFRICQGIGPFNPQLELCGGYECKYCSCSLYKVGTSCCVVLQNGTGNIERTGCERFQIKRRHLATSRAIENNGSPFL